ncbi:hypothetical protein [Novosphingobium huizhouense]|uniref:hypothetical protein n=1 Tax=Novosphingobium huizhouense TaxID=2866625 RepID=UPI001CD8FFCF|nr:hypothetical protein [Novosphingobium huizhouense]
MTVETTSSEHWYYPGAGSLPEAIPFSFASADELLVWRWPADGSAPVLLVRDIDYTITGDGPSAAAKITARTDGAPMEHWQLLRESEIAQHRPFAPHSPFPARSVETALDLLTRVAQEQRRDQAELGGRAVRVQRGETINELPLRADRIDRLFYFDAYGEPQALPFSSFVTTPASAGTFDGGFHGIAGSGDTYDGGYNGLA